MTSSYHYQGLDIAGSSPDDIFDAMFSETRALEPDYLEEIEQEDDADECIEDDYGDD